MISGRSPLAFNCNAKAKSCMSVSDSKNESPTLLAETFTLFENSSEGILILILPLSTAVLKRTQAIELVCISSPTLGTVTCSSPSENGSNPAKNAEVSKTMIFLQALFVCIYHPVPLNSNRFLSRL